MVTPCILENCPEGDCLSKFLAYFRHQILGLFRQKDELEIIKFLPSVKPCLHEVSFDNPVNTLLSLLTTDGNYCLHHLPWCSVSLLFTVYWLLTVFFSFAFWTFLYSWVDSKPFEGRYYALCIVYVPLLTSMLKGKNNQTCVELEASHTKMDFLERCPQLCMFKCNFPIIPGCLWSVKALLIHSPSPGRKELLKLIKLWSEWEKWE